MRQIVLDTETTGLEPELGHRIIEIGCIEILNRRPTGRTFHHYLNPDRDIDKGALEVHGITLEQILNELVAHYGWSELGQQVNIRCFTTDPSVPSSLKFLRRTPWAREKVESLYLFMLREQKRRDR